MCFISIGLGMLLQPNTDEAHNEAYRGIKEIVGHKFANPRKFKSDLLLNILWDDEKAPIGTSWNKSLGEEETVHKYLNSNYMARFIPKS